MRLIVKYFNNASYLATIFECDGFTTLGYRV